MHLQNSKLLMVGGGSGGVSGEGLKKHLTIGKADKQRDLVRFGEVLAYISMKTYGGEVVLLVGMVRMKVTDGRRGGQ